MTPPKNSSASISPFVSSHGLASGVLRAAIFIGLLAFAFRAQADDVPTGATNATNAPKAATCVFKDLKAGEACPAFSTARSLEFLGMGDEAIIFVEQEAPIRTAAMKDGINGKSDAKPERISVLASSRLEDSVLLEQIDEDDAMLLEREVLELSGARYELPKTRSEVKKIVGFPESAEVASDDWIEMIRVHAEMTLSLSKNASRFLLEQLGLASSATGATAAAASVLPTTTAAATTPSPIESQAGSHPAVVETH